MAKNLAQQRREEMRTSALSLEGFTQRVWPISLENSG